MKNKLFDFLKKTFGSDKADKINSDKQEANSSAVINKEIVDDYGILGVSKRNIWVFNSGLNFSGNPKWLFVYINKYRSDIKAFWLCTEEDTVEYIRSLGYKAYLYSSKEGIEIATAAGVYVTEQCKEIIQPALQDTVCLNLYHGVGCKSIERKVDYGFLFKRIMKKYIVNNNYYLNNMLFLVTSPLMKEHFKNQVGLSDDMVIEAGYPRCIYQQNYERLESFDHDILKQKNRSADTKIIVYAPTYRDNPNFDFVNTLLPDMEALEKKLKENNQLLVFKIHPLMKNDFGFSVLYEKYVDSPYFLFWNNENDIYEIIDKIDTAIIDYSSIFYDFLAGGVKNFIRYFADYGSTDLRDNVFDYKEMTCGKLCNSFEELLSALDNCVSEESEEEEKERKRIYDLFWQYSSKDSMDKIIDTTLGFKIKKEELPTLYTFDVFDTLISRKGLHPFSIFCKVKEQMEKSSFSFDRHFLNSYVDIRVKCETNVREYRRKTAHTRNSEYTEISFDSIFERMKAVYNLSSEQIEFLKETELACEFEDAIAIDEMIAYAESLVKNGNDVLLISDMYLPGAFIKKLIGKHSEILSELPLYVSCEYGVHKSTGLLYQEVYKDIGFYGYGQWIHHGDNANADGKQATALGIKAVRHTACTFNDYEKQIVASIGTYDAYLVAALMARFRQKNSSSKDYFAYACASLCLVPYSIWVAEDAQRRGYETLYFIARDGYHTQKIADIAIEKLNLNVKTKYIYGSRRAWRIPSFIEDVDESFFLSFGTLATSTSFEEILASLSVNRKQFEEFFPALCNIGLEESVSSQQMSTVVETVKASKAYREYFLKLAAEKRINVDKYLSQEIDFSEKFAFVDYWGRGYTQTCLTRLLHNIEKREFDVPFYYLRSIYPSDSFNVRYNYTTKDTSMLVVEALCSSNINYKSIENYELDEDGTVKPVIIPEKCDLELLYSMKVRLCNFTEDFLSLPLSDRQSTLRDLLDFTLNYYSTNQNDPLVIENVATLSYALSTYAKEREYAPALTKEMVEAIANKTVPLYHITNSLAMSLERSDDEVVEYYDYLTKELVALQKQENKELRNNEKLTVSDFKNKQYSFDYDSSVSELRKKYRHAAKKEVEKKIVVISSYNKAESEFASLISLYEKNGYSVVILPLKKNYKGKMLSHIATAKYIFMSNVSGWFSKIKFRKETKLIQFYRQPILLKGISQVIEDDFSEDKIQRILRIHKKVYSLISCSGDGIAELYKKSYVNEKNINKTKVLGNPLTDVYFSEERKAQIKKKLSSLIKEPDKKLMVYLPKTTNTKRFSYQYLDLGALEKLFGKDYNILVISNKEDDIISAYAKSFENTVYEASAVLTQREAMAVSDVIIGDFSGVLLEGVLTGKPIFFTSQIKEDENESFVFEDNELSVAPVITDAFDLLSYLRDDLEYSFEKQTAFKEKYLNACDGSSAEKIFSYLHELEEAAEKKTDS